jgi:hypothetical protein
MKYLRNIPMEERFWNKVEKTDDCWNWIAHREGYGYGVFNWERKTYRAHRVSFYLTHGHFPLICRHMCDNPSCVRPDHLEDGTSYDNAMDRSKRGRHFQQKKTHCPEGHLLSGDNLYMSPKGHRNCRACRNEASRRYRRNTK